MTYSAGLNSEDRTRMIPDRILKQLEMWGPAQVPQGTRSPSLDISIQHPLYIPGVPQTRHETAQPFPMRLRITEQCVRHRVAVVSNCNKRPLCLDL